MIPDIAIGALGAAAIAAIVSLLGLIISKEQKTSEFRQAWIDALRSEITAYLTHFNAISDAIRVRYEDHADKVKALSPHYSQLNEANFSISLRLNPKERLSSEVLKCISELQALTSNETLMTPANIRPIEARLLLAAKNLLKFEWRRVKHGELTFKASKLVSLLLALSAIACAGFIVRERLVAASVAEPTNNSAALSPTPRQGDSVQVERAENLGGR